MSGKNILRTAAIALTGAIVLWLAVAYCLPVLLPFLIGLLAARLALPLAGRLEKGLRFPRWAAAFLSVSGVFAMLALGVWMLAKLLLSQLASLARALPGLFASLEAPAARLTAWLYRLCGRAPGQLGAALRQWLESSLQWGEMLSERVSDTVLHLMGGMVTSLPDVLLFTVTAVLSGFMLCARLPELRRRLRKRLPPKARAQLRKFTAGIKTVLSGWFKAQLKLAGVTFAIVTAGLMLLRVPYALVLGLAISLIDALPVLGSGTVLLPWSACAFLQGNTERGLWLALLYALAALSRTALEPRLLGRQLGLPPLLTLIALYSGFRLCGVAGMLLFPIGAIVLRQAYELIETAMGNRPQT